MHRLPPRRNSLCLFCAFARPPPPPPRLVARIHVANRSTTTSTNKKHRARNSYFNPLDSRNSARPRPPPLPEVVGDKLGKLKEEFVAPEFLASLQLSRDDFDREWLIFNNTIRKWVYKAPPDLLTLVQEAKRGKDTLQTRLRKLFYAQIYDERFTTAELENQKGLADLRYPHEWYPLTREIPRTVHLHVGPTNSGKTYHALKRLEEAQTGIYLGPLRLLAHEVYTRLNAKGKACALVTGEEQRMPDGDKAAMFSCTVEMAPLNTPFDVAVIDEIQMISHMERGWAWTQAFLGLQANEIHLCGEARTVPLMRELCALVGDKVHVHEYNRLTPLKIEPQSLRGDLTKLEKGDCIVAFTVVGIHALRKQVERKTGKKCAIIYGSLPPETRAQQARLFNDPDNDYDYLVASDAIGMGLNLAVKRVIFESTVKNNGLEFVSLQISEVKQIAGRAGRYKTAHQAVTQDSSSTSVAVTSSDTGIELDDNQESKTETVGWVTTLDDVDHGYLKKTMRREPEEIKSAGLFPPSLIIERFANYFPPGTPFSYIMLRLHEISESHPRFHLCALKDQLAIADVIHLVKNLSIQDRITICAAPISMRSIPEQAFLRTLAECIADGTSGSLLDIPNLPLDALDKPATRERSYLYSLEQLHKMIVCYLWLSYRFPNVFTTRTLANYTKKLVEDKIEKALTQFSSTELAQEKIRKRREKARKELEEIGDDNLHSRADGQRQISVPPGLPEEATNIANKAQAFVTEPPTDDVNEYPDDMVPPESSTKSSAAAQTRT